LPNRLFNPRIQLHSHSASKASTASRMLATIIFEKPFTLLATYDN
jgi:hypothetical protein